VSLGDVDAESDACEGVVAREVVGGGEADVVADDGGDAVVLGEFG
jgi:hypothetical protein